MEQKNLILGFDFGEKYSQFCCYDRGTHTAVSIPVKEGEEAVEFPTAIAKKRNEETWKTGPDAEKSAHTENGIWQMRDPMQISYRLSSQMPFSV